MAAGPKAEVLTRGAQKRWALFGCFGCLGFLLLAVTLSLLGFRNALRPENVWGQLSAYMEFEVPPEGFAPLFEVSFFDQRQIAFYRESDRTQVVLQEFSSRVREDFDEALDSEILTAGGATNVETGELVLQGRTVTFARFLPAPDAEAPLAPGRTIPGRLLESLGLLPADVPTFRTDTPVHLLRFSGLNDGGGTVLSVRAPTPTPLTPMDLEELFAPFDLWAKVDSAPAGPLPPEDE